MSKVNSQNVDYIKYTSENGQFPIHFPCNERTTVINT